MIKHMRPASLMCDFYKIDHRRQYPTGTQRVYSTWTPRGSRLEGIDKVVAFGFQAFVKHYLLNYFDENFFKRSLEDIMWEYRYYLYFTLTNPGNIQGLNDVEILQGIRDIDASHIQELWALGHIPLRISAVMEGTLIPVRVPMLVVENTNDKFFWFTNYIETLMSLCLWKPITNATIAFEYRKMCQKFALETVGNTDFVPFQGHDFSMRGMDSPEGAEASSAAHLLSFVGTDTINATIFLEEFYNADLSKELVGTSVFATEHSVMCSYGKENEHEAYRNLVEDVYPAGILSIVSDTYDFWNVLDHIIPSLKPSIMKRDGKIVIRPDSGDPVEIICGVDIQDFTNDSYIKSLDDCKRYMREILTDKVRDETPHGEHGQTEVEGNFKYQDKYYKVEIEFFWNRYDKQYYFIDESTITKFEEFTPTSKDLGAVESLWNTFGGTITDQGYKLLDSHIGVIYGDSITLERAGRILEGLKAKGFASINVVLGIGSFTYQFNTRDTFQFAMKATHVVINGEEKQIFKDPITDSGMKKSQKGRVVVLEDLEGDVYSIDGLSIKDEQQYNGRNLLKPIFENGMLLEDFKLSDIRKELLSNL